MCLELCHLTSNVAVHVRVSRRRLVKLIQVLASLDLFPVGWALHPKYSDLALAGQGFIHGSDGPHEIEIRLVGPAPAVQSSWKAG